ncbi:MAG: hypothetical protein U5K73_08385 [Halofilum sp. (in: g-proteobacteria)]|nr:hypothetical protein [Halofilum sp. (in: g-proteobacteria)]
MTNKNENLRSIEAHSFLKSVQSGKRRWRAGESGAEYVIPQMFWTGKGRDGLEVAYATADRRPPVQTVRQTWKKRHGNRSTPVLLVIGFVENGQFLAQVCGPSGEQPSVATLSLSHAERIAATALAEPDRHMAHTFVARSLTDEGEAVPGLRNRDLLSSHEIAHGVPKRGDWADATAARSPCSACATRISSTRSATPSKIAAVTRYSARTTATPGRSRSSCTKTNSPIFPRRATTTRRR